MAQTIMLVSPRPALMMALPSDSSGGLRSPPRSSSSAKAGAASRQAMTNGRSMAVSFPASL